MKRVMQFAPVIEDDDEISRQMKEDQRNQDDVWQLTDELDSSKLEAFWDDALKELGPAEAEKE